MQLFSTGEFSGFATVMKCGQTDCNGFLFILLSCPELCFVVVFCCYLNIFILPIERRTLEMTAQPGSFLSKTVDCFTRPGAVQLVNENAEQLQADYLR